jgi:hypothetical protein
MVAKLLTRCGMIWRSLGQVVSGQRGWTATAPGVRAVNGVLTIRPPRTLAELSYRVPLVPAFPNLSTV